MVVVACEYLSTHGFTCIGVGDTLTPFPSAVPELSDYFPISEGEPTGAAWIDALDAQRQVQEGTLY
jgi:exosome complex exonuclease DIS3/RRP44